MSFAYGLGLPHWQPLSGGFSPAGLFQAGVIGTFYDPSDPTTLFTTSTGTTPCAVPGSGSQVLVGLMLDKSQGAPGALGAELAVNGSFAVDADWIKEPGWSISGGQATKVAGAAGSLYQGAPAMVQGRIYQITFSVTGYSAGTLTPFCRGTVGVGVTANGTYTQRLIAGADSAYAINFFAGATFAGSIDNISVREIPGNHAIAFNDTTARPELSARVNLLTYSEQFDNAAWVKQGGATVTANTVVAPDGTTTADSVSITTASNSAIYQSNVGIIGTQILSVWARTASGTAQFKMASYSPTDNVAYSPTFTATTTWQQFSWTRTVTALSGWYPILNDGTLPATTIFAWGADLRPANIGSAIPSYQRIADQYTYDSNGFPSYLRFDGVDDSMYTPAGINFSGTDKMSVFAGVRKLSDAALSMLTELSTNAGTNFGSFFVAAPRNGATADYGLRSLGTSIQDATSPTSYAAPITNVLTGIADINAPVATLKINGTQVATNTASQGTGNYGTYPLYIGSRNNASLRFNGHLYSLIIAGTQLQSGSITATEQYVAGKTGVQI